MTGPLARTISHAGLRGVMDAFDGEQRRTFEAAYCAAYRVLEPLIAETYDEVRSGNEIASVGLASTRLDRYPMAAIDGSRMWAVGQTVRRQRGTFEIVIDPLTAAMFCAAMVAQIDVLHDAGHPWSEIANESVVELVDSLIPYMHARGVAAMIDNCSLTSRLGARKWAPRFEAAISQQMLPALETGSVHDQALLTRLDTHPIHDVLATISRYRPTIDIAV
jgi:ketol-acid reductoisomerase